MRGNTTVDLWLQLLIFHIQFKATCFCNMTGFTGFENLFRPLHFPLLFSSPISLPSCHGDNERTNGGVGVEVESDSCDSCASLERKDRRRMRSRALM